MAKYIRQTAPVTPVPVVPAVDSRPGQAVTYNLITQGPNGTVYSTAETLITADGAVIPSYYPAYSTGRPVPAGKGRG